MKEKEMLLNPPKIGDRVKIVLEYGMVEDGIVINWNEDWIELGSVLKKTGNTLQLRTKYIMAVQIFKNNEVKSVDIPNTPKVVKEQKLDLSSVSNIQLPVKNNIRTDKIINIYENNKKELKKEISPLNVERKQDPYLNRWRLRGEGL